ncbi:MAG: PTS sugar transporter subunit IIA [Pseudomonadota bacterium]
MIGIVVVSHGKLAQELIYAAEHVVGKQTKIKAICIDPEDDMEIKREEIISAVKEVDSGKGIVILTDMFGGTPSNLAISIIGKFDVEVIAGVNLPLLVKLASIRSTIPVSEAIIMAQEAGRKYINIASNMLSKDNKDKK